MFPFMVRLSRHGILKWVTFDSYFWPLFLLPRCSQVAPIFTFFSIIFCWTNKPQRFHRGLSYLNTLANSSQSQCFAELYPMVIHFRTTLYLNTSSDYTQNFYITVVFLHNNTSQQFPQTSYLVRAAVNIFVK